MINIYYYFLFINIASLVSRSQICRQTHDQRGSNDEKIPSLRGTKQSLTPNLVIKTKNLNEFNIFFLSLL